MKNSKGNTGNRYTDAQKKDILNFIERQGRGGISAAQKKYNVSYIAIASWKEKGFGSPMKSVLAKVPTKAKRGRPAKVLSNRPISNKALVKMITGLRSTINRAETKTRELEAFLQPA